MKPRLFRNTILALATVTVTCSSITMHRAHAATYYWDGNDSAPGFGDATGTWADPTLGTLTSGWSTSSAGTSPVDTNSVSTLATAAATDAVNFGTNASGLGAGTITVSGIVNAGNITFGSQSGSIVLSGGTINRPATATNFTVNSITNPSTIASDITGGAPGTSTLMSKTGNGTLYLSGDNTYLSGTYATGGVLVLDSPTALPVTGLTLNGMVGLGAYGDMTRLTGVSSGYAPDGRIYWRGNGGFAAYGANRNVNLGGAGGYVVFGSGAVGPTVGSMNGKRLILGAADATHTLNWQNGLEIGSGIRDLQINDGLAAVDAEMSGGIRGAAGAGFNKHGTGTLLISSANTQSGPINLNAGTIIVGESTALGSSSASTILTSGAVLDLNGFNIANTSALTLSGTGISNSGALINSSASPSSHAGPVTLGSAEVRIGGVGTIDLGNPATIIGNGSSLTLAGAGGSLGGGLDTGAAQLVVDSSGTWSLFGTSLYTGPTLIDNGSLALVGSASINGSSTITVDTDGGKLLVSSSAPMTSPVTLTQGTLTGSGSINSVEVGNATGGTISNNNGAPGASFAIGTLTFNGGATVNTYSIDASAPIATTNLATNAAGTVTINASSLGWADNTTHELISYGGGSVGGAGSAQFVLGTVSGLSARQVASPTLGDSGTAITLTISGDTPYWTGDGDGAWNVASADNWKQVSDNAGTLYLTNDNVLFNDNASGTGSISVNIDAADVAPNSTVFNNSTKDYVITSSGNFGITSGALVKNGTGKLSINNANSYPGGTTLNAGTLQLGNANAIGSGLLTINGGSLDSSVSNLVNAGNNPQLWNGDFTFIGTESLNLGTGAVTMGGNRTIDVSANNLTIGGVIGGGAVDLTKLGAGTLTLAGGGTFTGNLVVNAGTVAITPAAAGSFSMSNGLIGTTSLNINPFAADGSDISLGGNLSGFTGTVNLGSSGGFNSKLNAGAFGAGAVVNIPSGATWNSSANQEGITINVAGMGNSENNGALQLGNVTLSDTTSLVLKSDTSIGGTGSSTISATISEDGGSFGFTKQGAGTLILTGANTYNGPTAVSAGVLVLQNPAALGGPSSGNSIADGTRVELHDITVTGEDITLAGAGGDNLGVLNGRTGTNVWTGNVTVDADLTRIGASTGASLEVSGVIDDGPNDYRIRFRPQSATATVIVSGANTYTGGTSIFGGPVVASSLNSVVGGSPSSSFGAPVTAANGVIIIGIAGPVNNGTLSYVGAGETTDRTIQIGDNSATPAAGDTGAGAIENNGNGALVFSAPVFNSPTNNTVNTIAPTRVFTLGGTNTENNTIEGVIQNNQVAGNPTAPVALTKTGAGTWILKGANTYTGATTVSQGTLALVGGSQSSPISVASGASLAFDVASPTTSTSTYNLSAGTIKIIGTPTLASYTLTTSTGITGTPTLDAPIEGYALVVEGNSLKLNYVPYDLWASGFPSFSNTYSDVDFDGDGLVTGLEYVLGGNPTANDAASIAPTAFNNGSGLVFTFRRADVANSDPSATVYVEYSSDLNSWTTAQDGVDGVSIVATNDFYGASPGIDKVEVTMPAALAGTSGKLFARLGVSGLPLDPVLFSENFESDDGGFTISKVAGTSWAWGAPASGGPGGVVNAGNNGSLKCWGTDIGNPGYFVDPTTDSRLISPVIDLTNVVGAQLSFAHAIDIPVGDSAVVRILNANTNVEIVSGVFPLTINDNNTNAAAWQNSGPHALPSGAPIRVVWTLTGVGSSTDDYIGWYVDDVSVVKP